jgi:hypothetical protein
MQRARGRLSADDIASTYRQMVAGYAMLGTFAQTIADELMREKQKRTARGYLTAARRLIEFNNGYDIRIDALTPEVIARFEQALEHDNLSMSTISFYMRTLRAVYNRAVVECIIPARLDSPFDDAYTQIKPPHEASLATA